MPGDDLPSHRQQLGTVGNLRGQEELSMVLLNSLLTRDAATLCLVRLGELAGAVELRQLAAVLEGDVEHDQGAHDAAEVEVADHLAVCMHRGIG